MELGKLFAFIEGTADVYGLVTRSFGTTPGTKIVRRVATDYLSKRHVPFSEYNLLNLLI